MAKLQNQFLASIAKLYDLPSTRQFTEFFQGELCALQFLATHEGKDVFPSMLANALHVTRARITATLVSLRKKNFVVMEMCEEDRRRMLVYLTPTGKAYIDAKRAVILEHIAGWTQKLGEEDTRQLMALIDKLSDAALATKK